MKYVRTPGFLIDLRRLPDEHRALRIHRIGAAYSMTWSFSGPDGRALFRLAEVAGETVVVWLRVGNHGIYDS
jgi:hypothetical protein